MERSKLVLWIVVGMASFVIIWWVGFHNPVDGPARGAPEPSAVGEPNMPGDVNEPPEAVDANEPEAAGDANEPERASDVNEPGRLTGFDERRGPRPRPGRITDVNDPNRPADVNEPMESVNLKGVEMKMIIQKLADWTGKTVIPDDEAMKQKITIYAPDKLPRSKALSVIYNALWMKGFTAEHIDDMIFLSPSADVKLRSVPTIGVDTPLATLENKDQIVQKFFDLENYSPTAMLSVIQPLIGEHGHVSADENARSLLVIDTVSNLMRLENIIKQFDIPEAAPMVTEIFEVHYGDPSEIVQMLNILLGTSGGRSSGSGGSYRPSDRGGGYRPPFGSGPRPSPQPPSSSSSSSSKKSSSSSSKGAAKGAASSVVVGATRGPVILIAEPRRKWIIARGSAEDIEHIRQWIEKLDVAQPVESEYEVVQLRYADPEEVEDSIEDGFKDLPGTQFLPSVLVEPLRESKQVIIFGRKDLRDIVKKMIEEIDIPPGMFETQDFPLKHADPDQIKTMIEELFGQQTPSYSRYTSISYYGSSRSRSSSSSDMVKVISYATLKQVTVIASPEKMEEIAKQIAEWDKPLDVDQVRPRIITLKNSDPVEMADLLNTLFSEKTTGRTSIYDILFGYGGQAAGKIVGPLYGHLTFEDVPGTKKIIVISDIPEAYDVVEQLILDLDREEMAEVPKVITVKYADPEDLSERLNAMFIEAGQTARIRLTMQGLSESSAMDDPDEQSSSSSQTQSDQDTYTLPWSGSGARGGISEEMPLSNVIGRIRFVPEPHTKSILVLAPPEFMDEIEELITELDVPGKQVIIKAIIVEIEHTKMTSLGVQLATDPDAFGALGENAIRVLGNITNVGSRGSVTSLGGASSGGIISSLGGTVGATGSGTLLGVGLDVYALLDFLVKKTDARILNQQTLWTKDNEEARFFKGREVAFSGGTTIISQGGSQQDIEYKRVGMELRARPSITPERSVDMVVNVEISQLTEDRELNQPVISKMDTRTNMIVRDGETLLLGGILFQKDSAIERKLPGFGDLPLVGGLFRHNQVVQSNTELLVFITPHVVDEPAEDLPEATKEAIEIPREKLKDIMEQLDTTIEALDQ